MRRRHVNKQLCPICGEVCGGYLSTDGAWAYCTRHKYAHGVEACEDATPLVFPHRLLGPCEGGVRHDGIDEKPSNAKTPPGSANNAPQTEQNSLNSSRYADWPDPMGEDAYIGPIGQF